MSMRGQYIGGSASTSPVYGGGYAESKFDAPRNEASTSESTLNRIKGAIEYGHTLLERLETLEDRINGAEPQAVPKDGPAVGYGHSLTGEMQRTADAAEYLAKRMEEVITKLERFV